MNLKTIKDLRPDKKNANRGTARGRKMIAESLAKYGAGRSILVDRKGRVIAGNKTLEAASKAGKKRIRVVRTDGSEIVVVQRTDLDLDSQKARELAIIDNRSSELDLEWDSGILAALDVGLSGFWNESELQALIPQEQAKAPEPQLEKAAALQKKWKTERGQIWEIGKHRLMCGDSTEVPDLGRLMDGKTAAVLFTDPPYGVDYGGHGNRRRSQKHRPMENDALSIVEQEGFWARAFCALGELVRGDAYIAAPPGPLNMVLARAIAQSQLEHHQWLIWVKDRLVLGRSHYHYRHEHIWYGWKRGAKSSFRGGSAQDSVWEIQRPSRSDEHPTMKPVELAIKAIANSSTSSDLVLDGFIGAGSTMCAAEQIGRICYGMEIEPNYIAISLERLSEMGLNPKLLPGKDR